MPTNHCKKCNQEDTDEMVACDHCGEWFHFACVSVDSTVADRSWNCDLCQIEVSNVGEAAANASKDVVPISTSSPSSKVSNDNRQVKFTLPKSCMPPPTTTKSTPAIDNIMSSQPYTPPTTTSVLANAPPTFAPPPFSATTAPNSVTYLYPQYSEGRMQQAQHNLLGAPAASNTTSGAENSLFLRNLQLERLEEEMEIQKRYLENKYKILSQSEDCNVSYTQVRATTPTSAQLAARHTMPKNLPDFNGDPDEWPLFISSFENSTAVAGFSNAENLMRLQSCLKGRARDMVRNKLLLPTMVPEIIQTLRLCFGRPEHILERAISKARQMPALKDKLESIIEFALCVRNICATIESCHLDPHMHNPCLVKELVDKLPNTHKLNWAMFPKDPRVPVLKQLSDWLYKLAEAASTVVTLSTFKSSATVHTHIIVDHNDQNQGRVERVQQVRKCGVCESENHKVPQCEVFKNSELTRKWEFVRQKNLCRQCLGTHSRKCFSNKVCGINGCTAKHHQLLHKNKEPSAVATQITPTSQNVQLNTHSSSGTENQPLFRILPIKLYSHGKSFSTFAFLDEGSAVTLIEKSVFEQFGLQGIPEPICLRWTGNTTREERASVKANIEISSVTSGYKYELKDVHTVDSLDLPAQSLDIKEIYKRYPHLTGLPIQPYEHAKPTILIGINNWKLAIPLKIREGGQNQPIASKTRLGWTLQGCDHGNGTEFRLNVHRCDCQKELDELHEIVKEHFSMETPKHTRLLSADDNRAVQILNESYRKINGRYEVGLTWREKNVVLPESYPNALKRSLCLRKRVDKDPEMKRTIQAQIDNLVSKGYAEKLLLGKSELQTHKTWYLPIFIVTNPNKPGKVRLVWDAASKVNNMSLNDFLLSGPDLLNPLVEVLLAFRVGKIAISGDIAEMFHRINVRESDMYAQCFLWWNDDDGIHRPSIYVMRALTFGVCCAPFIAHFIRDKNAENFKSEFPRAVQAVQKCHYVDDFIDSEDDETSAIELAMQVRQIHASAGFNIRNWASNSTRLLEKLGENPAAEQNITKDWGSATKVLGMYWEPGNDLFRYIFRFGRLKRDVINEPVIPTKRETLQVLMSIFDPLGLISCYTIGLKILLQNIWRSGITWDEPLSDSLFEKWSKWKSNIQLITSVEIPRCYSLVLQAATSVQLHTFVDAGENAYAAICYLRVEHAGEVSVSLVAAKSKVAPLKTLSIPRLELQAALIGVRLAKTVLNVDRIRTTSQFWWTDSKTVLRWLQMDPKNFQQYVMHRVGEIVESSNVSQWKWVPSKMNPADLSTKTATRTNAQLWFSGPEFLLSPADDWPIWELRESAENNDVELKKRMMVIGKCSPSLKVNVEYFSNWRNLYRAVARFMLYIEKRFKSKQNNCPKVITLDMVQRAKHFLFRYAQSKAYEEEIKSIKSAEPVGKTSHLRKLNVYLDDDNLIRSKGRDEYLNNHSDKIVLPNFHHVTFLLVRSMHEKFHHQMHETIINTIQSMYSISHLRVLYRKVRRTCQFCKNKYAKPQIPQMAPLPRARLSAFERPFTHVGIDYFGYLWL